MHLFRMGEGAPRTWRRRVLFVLALILATAFVVLPEVFLWMVPAKHHGAFWNGLPFFDLGFGFGGGLLLFVVAKRAIKPLLGRSEDNYDSDP